MGFYRHRRRLRLSHQGEFFYGLSAGYNAIAVIPRAKQSVYGLGLGFGAISCEGRLGSATISLVALIPSKPRILGSLAYAQKLSPSFGLEIGLRYYGSFL